jgi:hypothetical protein
MASKTLKRLLSFILIPVVVLLVLVGIAAGILYSQQQRLVELAVKELNKISFELTLRIPKKLHPPHPAFLISYLREMKASDLGKMVDHLGTTDKMPRTLHRSRQPHECHSGK